MNSIALERTNLLLKTLSLAAVTGVLIPTFAFAQSTNTSYFGPAPAPSPRAALNGSVTQSTSNGSSSGMRMTRGQAVGDSLFSSDAMSSFSSAPVAITAPVRPPAPPQMQQEQQQPAQQAGAEFDFGKAISVGSSVLHGFNQFVNATRPISGNTVLSGAATGSGMTGNASRLLNFARPLNRNEISLLANYDVAVIIDRSGSMQQQDCPGGLSRWDFCREQMLNLTNQASSAFRNGITVALFSSGYRMFNNVNFAAVPAIFENNYPDGGTYLSKPLEEILSTYFARRDSNVASHVATRPLLIEVITDGEPSDKEGVIRTICESTQRMSNPREVSIQFLQIGNEGDGARVLEQLDNGLVSEDGAQYDIVKVEPFSAVVSEGLARSLVNAATN